MHPCSRLSTVLLSVVLFSLTTVTPALADSGGGAALYRKACAGCHGVGGTGIDPHTAGFDTPLPDFTDCSFASREPDGDWLAVAHDGGPVRAFERFMPAFGDALTTTELQLILDHVRTFCRNDAWPRGELNLPRPLVTEKAFPEDEAVFTTTVSAGGEGRLSNELVFEKRFGPRGQLELAVPFGWREQSEPGLGTDWRGGLGDLAVGWKHAVWHSLERGSIFSLAAEVIVPTGDHGAGFGKGTVIVEPFLAYGRMLPRDAFLHLQGGLELPLKSSRAEEEAFWRGTIGRSFTEGRFGRVWSPMVEILGSRALNSGAGVDWDAVPQFQVTLNQRQHVMANLGVRIPLNHRDERDAQVMLYLLWDWFDGGLFEGW
jgi:mono/diheme cytochrome c family protein